MRGFSIALQNALLSRTVVFRDFLWLVPRDRVTGDPAPYGFWSDVGNVAVPVINPLTGGAVTRNFEGAGSLISISDIPAVSNITVQTVTIRLSQLNETAQTVVRGYDLKQARTEIFSGYFDPESRILIEPAFCRFQGFVDEAPITTPKENEQGFIELTCTSHTSELTRSNPDKRSHDSQLLRNPADGQYKYTAAVGDWNVDWGQYGHSASSGVFGRPRGGSFG